MFFDVRNSLKPFTNCVAGYVQLIAVQAAAVIVIQWNFKEQHGTKMKMPTTLMRYAKLTPDGFWGFWSLYKTIEDLTSAIKIVG
jgi:hypothetical protein